MSKELLKLCMAYNAMDEEAQPPLQPEIRIDMNILSNTAKAATGTDLDTVDQTVIKRAFTDEKNDRIGCELITALRSFPGGRNIRSEANRVVKDHMETKEILQELVVKRDALVSDKDVNADAINEYLDQHTESIGKAKDCKSMNLVVIDDDSMVAKMRKEMLQDVMTHVVQYIKHNCDAILARLVSDVVNFDMDANAARNFFKVAKVMESHVSMILSTVGIKVEKWCEIARPVSKVSDYLTFIKTNPSEIKTVDQSMAAAGIINSASSFSEVASILKLTPKVPGLENFFTKGIFKATAHWAQAKDIIKKSFSVRAGVIQDGIIKTMGLTAVMKMQPIVADARKNRLMGSRKKSLTS